MSGSNDQEILRTLVTNGEKLGDGEREAFGDMLDQLDAGRRSSLTAAQRAWADRTAQRVGVESEASQNLWSAGKVPAGTPGPDPLLGSVPAHLRKPLKPPGRR